MAVLITAVAPKKMKHIRERKHVVPPAGLLSWRVFESCRSRPFDGSVKRHGKPQFFLLNRLKGAGRPCHSREERETSPGGSAASYLS